MYTSIVRPLSLFLVSVFLLSSQLVSGQTACPPFYGSVCIKRAPFTLTYGNPAGGVYSGKGVENGIFSPAVAGNGTQVITYSYTDDSDVARTCNTQIGVYETLDPQCSLGIGAIICSTAPPGPAKTVFNQCGTFPTMDFFGPGIIEGNVFNPALVETEGWLSMFTVVADADGCSGSAEMEFYVIKTPVVSCPADIYVPSASEAAFLLTGASSIIHDTPPTYSGSGVTTGNVFNPGIAGNGEHIIKYRSIGADPEVGRECVAECSFKIFVGTLPVTLKRFEAQAGENSISLTWETATETNFDHFEIERSADPKKDFQKINKLKGQGKNNRYQFLDQSVDKGIPYYYRLKMVDTDGSYAYSKITWALVEGENELAVFPNPASGQLNIQSPLELTHLEILNPLGIEIFSEDLKMVKTRKIGLTGISPGIYLLRVTRRDKKSVFSRIVIK